MSHRSPPASPPQPTLARTRGRPPAPRAGTHRNAGKRRHVPTAGHRASRGQPWLPRTGTGGTGACGVTWGVAARCGVCLACHAWMARISVSPPSWGVCAGRSTLAWRVLCVPHVSHVRVVGDTPVWCLMRVVHHTRARCHTCTVPVRCTHTKRIPGVSWTFPRCHQCPAHPLGTRIPHSEPCSLQDTHGGGAVVAGAGVSPRTFVRHGQPVTGSGDARGHGGLPAAGAPRCRAVPAAGLSREALPGRPAVASRGCQLAGVSWPRAVTFPQPPAGGPRSRAALTSGR